MSTVTEVATSWSAVIEAAPAVVPAVLPLPTGAKLTPELSEAIRHPYNLYQLDLVAYPGNSGSPLYDPDDGAVHGIVNSVFVKGTKESALTHPSGISYAIPARYLRELLEKNDIRP